MLKISNEDAAFVLGKNGKTKEKIARVSGADLDLFEHSLTLEIRGTDDERKRAKKCATARTSQPHSRPCRFFRIGPHQGAMPRAGTSSA